MPCGGSKWEQDVSSQGPAVFFASAFVARSVQAMSSPAADAAAATAGPPAADKVTLLRDERRALKRQLAETTKELRNQESHSWIDPSGMYG